MGTPAFCLPGSDLATQESVYAEMASRAGRPVLPTNERVYSITFRHDGEEWTATVGSLLSGHTIARPQDRAQHRRVSRPVNDDASVVAIFPGRPYLVVTNAYANSGVRTKWANPFMAGDVTAVTTFASDNPSGDH